MPHWNEVRRKYYEEIGWDGKTGHPTEETLKRYGLDHAIPELRALQSAPQKANP
jgi:aldehyde:ferredoxin oxidoreductase